jgi:aldehyde dehydrogenase family 7 protein A1
MGFSRRVISGLGGAYFTRCLSSRSSSILSSLGISTTTELPGVYDGQWRGSGDIFESVCPTTGEVLARVKSVSGRPIIKSHVYV